MGSMEKENVCVCIAFQSTGKVTKNKVFLITFEPLYHPKGELLSLSPRSFGWTENKGLTHRKTKAMASEVSRTLTVALNKITANETRLLCKILKP